MMSGETSHIRSDHKHVTPTLTASAIGSSSCAATARATTGVKSAAGITGSARRGALDGVPGVSDLGGEPADALSAAPHAGGSAPREWSAEPGRPPAEVRSEPAAERGRAAPLESGGGIRDIT